MIWLVFLTYCYAPVYAIPMPDEATCEQVVKAEWRGSVMDLAMEGDTAQFSVIACKAEIPTKMEGCGMFTSAPKPPSPWEGPR